MQGKIAIGQNSDRSPCSNSKIKTHAEIDALRKINNLIRNKKIKQRNKVDLLVLRVNKLGNLCQSAPCLHCSKELTNSYITIDKLYFSTTEGTIKYMKFDDWISNPDLHMTSSGWRHCGKCSQFNSTLILHWEQTSQFKYLLHNAGYPCLSLK